MSITFFMLLRRRPTMGGNQVGGLRRPVDPLPRRAQGWSTKPPNPMRAVRMGQVVSLPHHRLLRSVPKQYERSGLLGVRVGPLTMWRGTQAVGHGAGMMTTSQMMMASMHCLTGITRVGLF